MKKVVKKKGSAGYEQIVRFYARKIRLGRTLLGHRYTRNNFIDRFLFYGGLVYRNTSRAFRCGYIPHSLA